jgi:hypothetical protein
MTRKSFLRWLPAALIAPLAARATTRPTQPESEVTLTYTLKPGDDVGAEIERFVREEIREQIEREIRRGGSLHAFRA